MVHIRSPPIGRFIQEDNYYGDGLNLYAYCRNNPVKYVDPSGHGTESAADKNQNDKQHREEDKKALKDIVDEQNQNGGHDSADQETIREWAKDCGMDYDDLGVQPKSESGTVPRTRLETGARNLDELSVDQILALDDEAARIYEAIRNSSDDVARISSQTGIPEWKIQKIKDHVFNNDHILRDRVGTFDPDIEIADAWERLMNGNYNQNDLDLLNHEYYEHRFEEFFGTDYVTAHNRTVETGRVWDPYKEVD